MGISSILNIAKNGVFAAQTSVQVTSHNVANVNTEGYSRQEAVLEAATPMPTDQGLLGSGVLVKSVKRYADKFLDTAIAQKNGALQQQQTAQNYFERIQGILEEDNSSLSSQITNFFNAWQELTTDPTSTSVRTIVASTAQNLSETIRTAYADLKDVQGELNSTVGQEVADINRIVSSIAALNEKVFDSHTNGNEAGDYLDQRTQFFKELSGKIGVRSFEDKYGRISVLTAQGKVLVDGGQCWTIKAIPDAATGFNKVAWVDHAGNASDITDEITTGSLRSIIDLRDQHIGTGFLKQLDDLAEGIMTAVNEVHKDGVTLNNTTGIPFFKELTGNYAASMDVSDAVKTDINNIAATSTAANPTDNDIALAIASLGTNTISIGGSAKTLSDYVASITASIGQLTSNAQQQAAYEQNTMAAMESQRASISGVSIEEEMANLIKFQYAYQASAKLFNVADELFKTLLGVIQ
jgi:flagellar hook-associated protein 1